MVTEFIGLRIQFSSGQFWIP